MIRFASLGSGSSGNATLIESGEGDKDTRILLDCGFSVVELEKRLSRLGRNADTLTAIVITHEHSDHIVGAGRLSRKYKIPVWLTVGTFLACKDNDFVKVNYIDSHSDFSIGHINIHPFPVPHDAREPCQFVFSEGGTRLGVVTDLGCFTPHILKCLKNLNGLLLECNYDKDMLLTGAYPRRLKERVIGHVGHLDNQQAKQFLKELDVSHLQHIVGMHISEKNNKEDLVWNALSEGLNSNSEIVSLATQAEGFTWKEIY